MPFYEAVNFSQMYALPARCGRAKLTADFLAPLTFLRAPEHDYVVKPVSVGGSRTCVANGTGIRAVGTDTLLIMITLFQT